MKSSDYIFKLKDGRLLGYAQYGDPKGKPILLFHGWPSSRLQGARLSNSAKKLKVRLISLDRPGFGLSTFKENRKLLDYPNDVAQLANHLKIKKFAIVGISGGGPYSAVCAYKLAPRITKAGIVVGLGPYLVKNAFDGVAWIAKIGWENYRRIPGLKMLAASIAYIRDVYLPSNFIKIGFAAKPDRAMMTKNFIQLSKKSYMQAFKQGIKGPLHDLKIYTSPWGFKVNKIKSKVYLWYGDMDKNVSLNMGKYYASQIPNAKLTIYPNEGHFLPITHAQEILKTLA